MKILAKFFSKGKWLSIPLALLALIFLLGFLLNTATVDRWTDHLNHINHGIQRHHILLVIVHSLIIVGIYYGWGKKVEYEAKKNNLAPSTVKNYKRFRYGLIGFILLVDYIAFWH